MIEPHLRLILSIAAMHLLTLLVLEPQITLLKPREYPQPIVSKIPKFLSIALQVEVSTLSFLLVIWQQFNWLNKVSLIQNLTSFEYFKFNLFS